MSKKTVKPELAGGFRDYLPSDMIPRNRMLNTIKAVFERFGFLPMDTPGMERSEVLGAEDSDFLIYRAGLEGSQDMALRYDLTVPLARVVAANADKFEFPFKRYQFGRVWRGEKQQTGKGRYREFTQLDIDTVGSSDLMADAEILSVIYETLSELGLVGNFIIKVNNKQEVLAGLSDGALRILDKLDKIGEVEVKKELSDKFPTDFEEVIALLDRDTPVSSPALDELLENAFSLGVPEEVLKRDNFIVRGLGYYTGNVFEAVIKNLPELGSVFAGGRYDDLISKFSPLNVPAVGASVGVDRLFSALDQLGLLKRELSTAKVLVLNFDDSCIQKVAELVTLFRKANVPAELYLGQEKTLKGQLAYAVKREFSYAILVGPEELKKGTVQVKKMIERTQEEMPAREAIEYLKKAQVLSL